MLGAKNGKCTFKSNTWACLNVKLRLRAHTISAPDSFSVNLLGLIFEKAVPHENR